MNVKNYSFLKLITRPITVNPKTTLTETRKILLENKVKQIVIVDKKIPLGVITEKDIAKKIYSLGSKSIKSVKAEDFKSKKLFTLTRKNSVQECAQMMKKHRISIVIILNDDKTLGGIITKTNLITAFLVKESTPMRISQIMEKKLITAAPSDPILYIESLLMRYGISRIIIKTGQKPVGVVTFRDFVPAKIPQWIAESADSKEVQEYRFKTGLEDDEHSNQLSYLFPFHAADIMTSNPITVNSEKDVKDAITLMIKNNISGIPVVKNSRLVGIITKSDIIRILAK